MWGLNANPKVVSIVGIVARMECDSPIFTFDLDDLIFHMDGFHISFSAKTPELHVVAEDPDDDKFIECAVALKADFVISGDKSLIAIEGYMGIRIVTPKQFLDSFI